jgi:hypothetical protein
MAQVKQRGRVLPTELMRGKTLLSGAANLFCNVRVGLVAQLVEQCPFNSKSPVLAIFSSFLFSFATIAEPLISLIDSSV